MNVIINTTADFTGDWRALRDQMVERVKLHYPDFGRDILDEDFMTVEFDGFPHHPLEARSPAKVNVRIQFWASVGP